MATILISTLPIPGHVRPARSFATKLASAGHRVVFSLPSQASGLVRDGFECLESPGQFSYTPSSFGFSSLSPRRSRIAQNLRYVMGHWPISQLGALEQHIEQARPDVVVSDCLFIAPLLVARRQSIKTATLGVTPFRGWHPDCAPIGTGLAPASNDLQRLAYQTANQAIKWWFRDTHLDILESWNAIEPTFKPQSGWVFDVCKEISHAYLQCSVPSIEDLPDVLIARGVSFVGPMNPFEIPAVAAVEGPQKTVFVTWGTMQGTPPEFFMAIVRALAASPHRKLVLAAPSEELAKLPLLPPHVSVVSAEHNYATSLANADAFVSNGGFGGIKAALSCAMPVVCFGWQDDKMDVCGRISRAGCGISLVYANPTARTVVAAVERVLGHAQYKHRAEAVARELMEYESSRRAVDAIEGLL